MTAILLTAYLYAIVGMIMNYHRSACLSSEDNIWHIYEAELKSAKTQDDFHQIMKSEFEFNMSRWFA